MANQIDLTDKIVVDLDDDALFIGEDVFIDLILSHNVLTRHVNSLKMLKIIWSKNLNKSKRSVVKLILKNLEYIFLPSFHPYHNPIAYLG